MQLDIGSISLQIVSIYKIYENKTYLSFMKGILLSLKSQGNLPGYKEERRHRISFQI